MNCCVQSGSCKEVSDGYLKFLMFNVWVVGHVVAQWVVC